MSFFKKLITKDYFTENVFGNSYQLYMRNSTSIIKFYSNSKNSNELCNQSQFIIPITSTLLKKYQTLMTKFIVEDKNSSNPTYSLICRFFQLNGLSYKFIIVFFLIV